jgi:hypothetical protein
MRCGSGLLNDITTLIPRDRSVTLAGGVLLGTLPWAAISMSVSAVEGFAMTGKPLGRGNLNGTADTTERYERPTAIVNMECIINIM